MRSIITCNSDVAPSDSAQQLLDTQITVYVPFQPISALSIRKNYFLTFLTIVIEMHNKYKHIFNLKINFLFS